MYTNADINVSPAEREKIKRDERNKFMLAERTRKTGDKAQAQFVRKGGKLVMTDAQRSELLAPKSYAAYSNKPNLFPHRLGWRYDDAGNMVHILSGADAEAVRQGYYCSNCLDLQKEAWTPVCTPLRGEGCGTPKEGGFLGNFNI